MFQTKVLEKIKARI